MRFLPPKWRSLKIISSRSTIRLKGCRGFSLIEILLVLMIMGILASIITPNLGTILRVAKNQSLKNIAHTTQMGIETYFLLNGNYPTQSQDNLAFFTTLKDSGAMNKIAVNPFSGQSYQATESDGRISYTYTSSTQTYILTAYGIGNSDVVIELSNE